jgi:hypothetical protein
MSVRARTHCDFSTCIELLYVISTILQKIDDSPPTDRGCQRRIGCRSAARMFLAAL